MNNIPLAERMIPHLNKLFYTLQVNTKEKIFRLMENNFGNVYLYGTCITDLYFGIKPRDFDCVVNIENSDDILKFLGYVKIPFERTAFGGYRFEYNSTKIDIWNLKDSYGIPDANYKIMDLLETCTLNVQSVLYDISRKQLLFDDKWMCALQHHLLDYVNLKTLYPEKLEKQTVKLKERYKFLVSYNLQKAIDKIKTGIGDYYE